MAIWDVYVPLIMHSAYGFFQDPERETDLFGYRVTYIGNRPTFGQPETVQGLCFRNVDEDHADHLLNKVRPLLLWASVVLNKAIRTSNATLHKTEIPSFDGRSAHCYPAGSVPNPVFASGSLYGAEASSKLIAALDDGNSKAGLDGLQSLPPRLCAAFDFYIATDFETSDNARFVVLTACLEVLATKPRVEPCAAIVDKWRELAAEEARKLKSGGDDDLARSFDELAQQVSYLKDGSVRGGIGRLVSECASAIGRPDGAELVKRAKKLYDARSSLVHKAESVTSAEVMELRDIVRVVLEAHALGKVVVG